MQRYTIEDKLGEGGMGVVYRARQNDLNRLVAIKYLLPDGDLTEGNIARFKREMQVLMSLSHPNIIRVFDAGESDGRLFYVMEMLAAYDLSSIFGERGPLPVGPVVSVLAQVFDALSYIHERKLIHRDIKPANIMLEENGRAVLMDFGLVRKVDGNSLLTAEGKLLGTPRYFAPEYIRGSEADASCDIWSMGVTAYELLSGQRPFSGDNLQELALAIVKKDPPRLELVAPTTPVALCRVVHRMLEKNPHQRYGSAAECLEALKLATDPVDLGRSAELSQEISLELKQQLAQRQGSGAPRPRSTGKTARLTGKSARLTGKNEPITGQIQGRATGKNQALTGPTAPRLTGSRIPAVAPAAASPSRKLWTGLAFVGVIAGLSGILYVARTPATLPHALAVTKPVTDLRVDYSAPDRLTAEFRTTTPTVWTLDCGDGVTATDPAPVTEHKLSVAASPMRAPERIALKNGGMELEARTPPSPGDRVRGLEKALVNYKLTEHTTDDLWHQIRAQIRDWQHVNVNLGPKVKQTGEQSAPEVAQRNVKADPSIAEPFHRYVRDLREAADVKRHLDGVLAMTPALLMSEQVTQDVRDDLLGLLYRLDTLDGLAEYMGVPPPFRISERMKPAVEISSQPVPGEVPQVPDGMELLYTPRGDRGMVLHYKNEDFLDVGGGRLDAAVVMEDSLTGWAHTEELSLGTSRAAGSGGRALHLWVLGLSTQLYPYLVPRGYKNGFPVRLHGTFYGLQRLVRFRVNVRGPLAQPGYWKMYLRRFFEPSSRLYFGLSAAGVESLSR